MSHRSWRPRRAAHRRSRAAEVGRTGGASAPSSPRSDTESGLEVDHNHSSYDIRPSIGAPTAVVNVVAHGVWTRLLWYHESFDRSMKPIEKTV
jgi:hypothetical protein